MRGSVFSSLDEARTKKVVALDKDGQGELPEVACPRSVSSQEMVGRKPVGRSPLLRIGPRQRVEIGIHPVVELPGGPDCEAFRKEGLEIRPDLGLGSIPYRQTIAVDVDLADSHSRIVIIDDGIDIVLPLPVSDRGESLGLQPSAQTLEEAELDSQMQGV